MGEETVGPIAEVVSAFTGVWRRKAVIEVVIQVKTMWPPILEIIGPPNGAARYYAGWYNHRHPNRKISWRKLSRPQRREAVDLWLSRK
jgi:hypothetical protein